MDDDFEITPAMRAYLAAFDRWLRSPRDELALQRRRRAFADLASGPRVRSCRRGLHLLTPESTYANGACRECQNAYERHRRRMAA